MRIAVCISGAFRASESTVARNLELLRSKGHTVDVFLTLQWPETSSRYRNSFDSNPHSRWSRIVPIVPVFVNDHGNRTTERELIRNLEPVKAQVERRSLEELLNHYGLTDTWHDLFDSNRPIGGSDGLRPHKPHFVNTLFMLANMHRADLLRQSVPTNYDGVLRVRPDFAFSEQFVDALDPASLVVPIRTSGREFNYGWGHMSDQCFFSSPAAMSILTSLVHELHVLWSPSRVFEKRSFSAPFLYGDVIVCYWKTHALNVPTLLVENGGDLVREKRAHLVIGQPEYRQLRERQLEWLSYNRRVSAWQHSHKPGSP